MLDRPVSWFRSLNPTLLDGLLALVLLVSEVYRQNHLAAPEPGHLATLAFIFAPLTLRRRWPIAVTWVIGGALLANLLLGFENSFFDNFAIVVAFYTVVANSASNLRLTLTIGFALVGINAGIALGWYNQRSVNLADLPYNWLLFALPMVLGYSVRTRRAYAEQLVERNGLLTRQVASEERTRIARELHDVIAHSVSVMVLQATAGARVAARDPSQALQSFEVIQQTGRDALSELRRALGVLRGAGESVELLPQPGLDQLEPLADQVRQAGVKVEIQISGEPRPLPAGVELSAYRIVQESLTNVLKHGGATRAVVEVAYAAAELLLEICDDGDVQPAAPAPAGHGLAGMRERVSMLGGDFQSGSVAGGYYVRAKLPIDPQTA